jgi:hypothetical protein
MVELGVANLAVLGLLGGPPLRRSGMLTASATRAASTIRAMAYSIAA